MTRKKGGNKTIRKDGPTDQNTVKHMGSPKNVGSETLKREEKRKILLDHSHKEAHMQNVVQSIATGPKTWTQRSNKESNGLKTSGSMFSPSVKGKKGIARGRASLSLPKGVAINTSLKDNSVTDTSSFLKHGGCSSDPMFTFNSSVDRSQQEANCYRGQDIKELQKFRGNEMSMERREAGAHITCSLPSSSELGGDIRALEVPEEDIL